MKTAVLAKEKGGVVGGADFFCEKSVDDSAGDHSFLMLTYSEAKLSRNNAMRRLSLRALM